MKQPKCKICGWEHALGAPHIFLPGETPKDNSAVKAAVTVAKRQNGGARPKKEIGDIPGTPAPKRNPRVDHGRRAAASAAGNGNEPHLQEVEKGEMPSGPSELAQPPISPPAAPVRISSRLHHADVAGNVTELEGDALIPSLPTTYDISSAPDESEIAAILQDYKRLKAKEDAAREKQKTKMQNYRKGRKAKKGGGS